jgi:hydrophobe/amphiphile efflux-1 (HAE1) family protein
MKLSDISIKNPVFAWMLMLSFMIFGGISFFRLGIGQMPDVDFPMVSVQINWEGAAPEVIELDVIDPVESALMSVEGVKSLTSNAKRGSANITVEFDIDKDINVAISEVETKMNQAARNLPEDIEPPIITKMNPEDRPIMWVSVSAPNLSTRELMSFVRDDLKDKFQTIPGVAEVFLGGYVEPNLRVWLDELKLLQYELTVQDIISAIQTEHNETPAGFITTDVAELNVRALGEANSTDDFLKLPLIKRGGTANYSPLFLGEVADVELGLAEIRRKSRVMGESATGLGIRKQRGANTVDVAREVKKKMQKLSLELPKDIKLGINFDSTTFIEESIHEINLNLILSSILTAIVCWFFLGSLSSTINVILAIPTSILGAFIFLDFFNFTLNTFTLLALSLAIGIVVDDAIMVLENIYRHFEMGKNKKQASQEGASEITFAALAATVSIMAIFLPVAFMDGIIGKYFFQFGVTLSVAVFLSYIEALTLTPMRTSQFMTQTARTSKFGLWVDKIFEKIVHSYEQTLVMTLNHRIKVLALGLIIFLLSLVFIKWIPKEFVPPQDSANLMVRFKTKDGSSLDFTDKAFREVEKYFDQRKEVKRYFSSIGGFGGNESNSAMMFITLQNKNQREKTQMEYMNIYREDLKNIKSGRVFLQDMSMSGFSGQGRGFPVEFSITGSEWDELAKVTKLIMNEMNQTQMFTDVDTDYKESVQELHLIPNREAAKNRGVSVADIGKTVSALVGGTVVGKYSQGGHRFDIRIKLKESNEPMIERMKKLKLRNTRGELVSLNEVIDVKTSPGVQSINRKDRSRAVSIMAGVQTGKSQSDAINKAIEIAKKHLPQGYKVVQSGNSEAFKSTLQSLVIALVMGILIAYMILGSQFNSFIDPLTVLLALPFSVSGAFIALYLTNQSINIYSMIGLILLMGIVKKNSILLVDFTHQRRMEGLNIYDALIDACPKRLRPILMTSISTIVGALPLALSMGSGSESLKPMSIAVIGGVVLSTFLTLYIVPAFYSLTSREKKVN